MATSSDGITWTAVATSSFGTTNISAVDYAPSLGLWIAVGLAGKLATSPDAVTWTQRTSGFGTNDIRDIAWSETLGLAVCGGLLGTVSTSSNGTTWSGSQPAAFGFTDIRGMIWNKSLGLFHGNGSAGGAGQHATSPNGTTWTTRTGPSDTAQGGAGVTSGTVSMLICVGANGTIDKSTDGSTWTAQDPGGATDVGSDVVHSDALGLYVHVSYASGSDAFIRTSPDTTTWTLQSDPFGANAIRCAIATNSNV